MSLPPRSHDAEDAFVSSFSGDEDPSALIEAIEAAMGERRPRLAARLVGLLGDLIEIEPGSDLDRAQRAAHLLLFDRARPSELSWSELEDAWDRVRRRRMRRIKSRMRASMTGSGARFGRLGNRRR